MHANRRRNATHWPCLPHGLTSPHVVIELLAVVELSVVVVLSAVVVVVVVVVVVDGDAVPVETLEKTQFPVIIAILIITYSKEIEELRRLASCKQHEDHPKRGHHMNVDRHYQLHHIDSIDVCLLDVDSRTHQNLVCMDYMLPRRLTQLENQMNKLLLFNREKEILWYLYALTVNAK